MKLKSNTADVVDEIVNQLENLPIVIGEIASAVFASNVERIHERGLDVNLRSIGKYSQKPIYVNPKKSPRKFSVAGKYGQKKFLNGTKHKTRYFEFGYLGYKKEIGSKPDGVVNLVNTGKQRRAFVLRKINPFNYALGFTVNGMAKRVAAQENKYHTQIYGVSKQDLKDIDEILNASLK